MKDQDNERDMNFDQNSNGQRTNMPGKQKSVEDDSELPGYPHYPPSEDIMNKANGARKVSTDPDELNRTNAYTASHSRLDEEKQLKPLEDDQEMEDDDLVIVPGTEADVTEEDLLILGPKDQDMDMGDDELMRVKLDPIGETGDDLDVPNDDLEDENLEALGQGDEENSYYSLGGDRHESLEEDNQQEHES